MKTRHLLAIIAFVSAFAFSAVLFRTFRPEAVKIKSAAVRREFSFSEKTSLQKDIGQFLETDKQNGLAMAADAERANLGSRMADEEYAVSSLVGKMRQMNCSGLPQDFCGAWVRHLQTWENLAIFLRAQKTSQDSLASGEYVNLNAQINLSYHELLRAARNQGVDFDY